MPVAALASDFSGRPPRQLASLCDFFQFLFNHRYLTAFGHSQLVLQHLLAETWQWPVEAYIPTPHPIGTGSQVPGARYSEPNTQCLLDFALSKFVGG